MKTKPTLDLSTEIEDWKNRLQKSGNFNPDDLMELESHLLDEMDNLQNKGLSDKEIFLIAQDRIGSCETICQAYKRSGKLDFGKNSLLAQAFLLLFTFYWLSKTATYLAGDIAIFWLAGDGDGFVVIHSLLQVLMAGAVYLIYKKTIQRNHRNIRANTFAICSLLISLAIHLTYARLSPNAYFQMMTAAPFVVLFSPYLIYFSVFVSIVAMNVKQWRKNRLSAAS